MKPKIKNSKTRKQRKIVDCCKHREKDKKCMRMKDKKIFKLPRRFTRKQCKNIRGFSMRSSCAIYKDCKN